MDLLNMSAVSLAKAIKAGETTAVEAMEAVIAQIEKSEKDLNCYVTFDKEAALASAKEAQAKIEAGELTGPLAGVPFAIKDNMCTKGVLTTCSSKILENFIPQFDSEAVKRLTDAGAVIIGKTNMDEFAMGSTTETSAYGPTKNPRNTEHVPGGSSGGSAAAVAANECFAALGSDTGGSIRQPASYCGVVGMKPTYGTVSRYGLIAYGSSLDQIGPLCKDVTDCATIMEVIAAHDPKDSTSLDMPVEHYAASLNNDIRGKKVGVIKELMSEGLMPEVQKALQNAIETYITSNISKLEEWSGYKYDTVIYDSEIDGKGSKTFEDRIMNHEHLYFIIVDDNCNVFGHYHDGLIYSDVDNANDTDNRHNAITQWTIFFSLSKLLLT